MTSTPATKRRRLDAASATLSKPFVSPFKTPSKRTPIENGTSASTHTDDPAERPSTASPSDPTNTPLTSSTTSAPPNLNSNPNPNSNPIPNHNRNHTPTPPHQPPTASDPALQKTHRALSARLRALRTEIDTLAQAVRIETGDADAELVALITKWKGASREAAEEVFGDVRDRVNRMGGVGAWRAEGMRREEWRGGWGGFDEGAERRGGDGAEEGEGESKREEVVDEGEDDDTFTMDMMLRGLNVDLDVIGFDKESQRWID